jgi:hypothetical protein
MLIMEPQPADWTIAEQQFRGGAPSGQRKLLAAINEIRPQYRLVWTFRAPIFLTPIHLLVRN